MSSYGVAASQYSVSHHHMDQFPAGTRVVFWDDAGKMKHGIVQSVATVDGAQVAFVAVDKKPPIKVPITSLSKSG